jgi:Trm5-related predicted tRNA methylase
MSGTTDEMIGRVVRTVGYNMGDSVSKAISATRKPNSASTRARAELEEDNVSRTFQ